MPDSDPGRNLNDRVSLMLYWDPIKSVSYQNTGPGNRAIHFTITMKQKSMTPPFTQWLLPSRSTFPMVENLVTLLATALSPVYELWQHVTKSHPWSFWNGDGCPIASTNLWMDKGIVSMHSNSRIGTIKTQQNIVNSLMSNYSLWTRPYIMDTSIYGKTYQYLHWI